MTLEAAIRSELTETEQDETARLRRLDSATISAAVARYQHRLYRYLYRLVRDPATAEDLFQQTWLNVVRQIGRYDGRPFETWLFAIAHNAAMDRLRRKGTEPLDDLALPATGGPADGFTAAVEAERSAILDLAVAGLPAVYREVLTLRFEEGMKLEEIAAVTQAPLSTVKSRLQRALEAARQSMVGKWRKEDLL